MNTFETIEQYNEARLMHDANHNAVKEYCRINKTNGIPCEVSKTFPFADKVDNKLREFIEVWEFLHDTPQKEFLYIDSEKKIATNWTGAKLGNVHFGREYRSNFGDKRVNVDVFGINGAKYHGIYFKSSGDYARLTPYKTK